jgi:hypothetical protein
MATLTIPDATYNMLVARAAKVRVPLEDFVVPLLEREPEVPAPPLPLTGEAWRQAFDKLVRDSAEWCKHLPVDHEIDFDYYREREDAQL